MKNLTLLLIFISTLSKAQITAGTFRACRNTTTQAYSTLTGGSWSSSNATRVSVDASTGVVSFNLSGSTATIKYTSGILYESKVFTCDPSPSIIESYVMNAYNYYPSDTTTIGDSLFIINWTSGGLWSLSDTSIGYPIYYGIPTQRIYFHATSIGAETIFYTRSNGCWSYKNLWVR